MSTFPTNDVDARAAALYFKQHLRVTHLGVLFVRDAYGSQFSRDLAVAATTEQNITLKAVPYEGRDVESKGRAMLAHKGTGFRVEYHRM